MKSAIFSADPIYADEAVKEFQTLIGGKVKKLGNGAFLLQSRNRFEDLSALIIEKKPIFMRHVCPAQMIVPLVGDEGDINKLARAIRDELADFISTSDTFSVQSRMLLTGLPYKPFELNQQLSKAVEQYSGARLNVREPQQVVSVIVGKMNDQLVGFMGVSDPALNLSDWAGGQIRFKREKGQLSRAEFKLLEALHVFDIDLPRSGIALDLGAAPGGWTRVLRQKGLSVVAVDPAELHPSLDKDKEVTHRQETAQDFLRTNTTYFDLIVNDMRIDSRKSAQMMVSFATTLKVDGYGILTLKLPQSNPYKLMSHSFNILKEEFEIVNARNLFHNRHEVTVVVKGKS